MEKFDKYNLYIIMYWHIHDGEAWGVLEGYPLYNVPPTIDILKKVDEMFNLIDNQAEYTFTNGNKVQIAYNNTSLYAFILWDEEEGEGEILRGLNEEMEIDEYLRSVMSVFDILDAHQYRKL